MKKIKDMLQKLFSKYKLTIYSGIIFSFITHFYYFTKRLSNEDDLSYLLFGDNALTSGRWNSGTLFTTTLMSPVVKFIFVILTLTICSILICDIFKIKSKKNMILIPLLLTTFPTLALSFSYLFMVEVYMVSLFLSVFAIWVTLKFKYGFILGSLSIAFSLGSYQAYIGFAVALVIIYIIKEIINKEDTKKIINTIIKLFLMGVIGVILYFVILNILLKINNMILSDYKGANSMGIPPISEWPKQLIRTYKHFLGYFLGFSFYKTPIIETLLRITTLVISFSLFIVKIIKEKIYLNKTNLIILILCMITIPLTFNIVDFMAYKTDLSSLQIYNYVLLYILCIVIMDGINKKKLILNIAIILLVIISYINFIDVNRHYTKLETIYSYTTNLNNRVLTRIESTENYNPNMPVMFIGVDGSNFNENLFYFPNINDKLTFDQTLWGGKYIGYADLYSFRNDKKIFKMFNHQFGIELKRASDEERVKVLTSDEYKKMGTYPEKDSIKVIEGILVVNF